jgi:Pyridoxamine 5'-phosphate oxidase
MAFRKMTDDEMADFLTQPLIAVLAIDDPGWSPHVAPVWFHHLPAANTFQVMTPAISKKARLHREGTGQLSLCIQTGEGLTAKYVNVQGVARLLPLSTDLLTTMVEKYLPEDDRAAYLANPPEDSMFDLTPRRITTGVIG